MSKIDLSVELKMTPRQAVYALDALRRYRFEYEHSRRTNSVLDGAHYRVRGALLDAGWEPDADGKGWHRRG